MNVLLCPLAFPWRARVTNVSSVFFCSLLKVASILETRIKSRAKGVNKLLNNIEELHEKIKELKGMGFRMAKFCHVEVLLQV